MAKDAARAKIVTPAAAPAPAPAAAPVRTAVPIGSVQLQSALEVSSPSDPAEKEAESTARRIVRLPAPEPTAGVAGKPLQSPHVARFHNAIARKAQGQPNVASNVAAEISASSASGSPLPATVRRFMEPRFRTDFSNVRVHTGERSARLNRQLNAQAFTVGNQIFFGRGRFRPETSEGRELVAHELTHTIQQGAAVQRSADVPVTQQSPPQVQRLGLSDALDYFADRANNIPGFRMFTVILGVNPINMSRVERSAANILRAVIEILPGGALITQALDNHGVFDRVGAWVEQQIRTLGMTGSLIRDAIDRFLDGLSWTDVFDLGGVWDRARRIFTEPIDRIFSFAGGLVTGILRFIKEAILRPLARLAEGTRGYDLLKAVLGEDPVTGDPVPRNAETLIGGFMRLIGQEEIWQNLQRSNAVARAWAWFQGALAGLMGFVRQIPSLFLQAFQSLQISDIVLLPRAFARIAGVFGGFIGNFLSWAGNTVWNLLEIIFAVVAPGVMVYMRRAAGAFRTILQNPIGFIRNLVRAGLLGLRQFATNFLTHLRASLIGWLTGAMSGANVYIPQGLNLREILKFVLSVLGLTWQNIRGKLVRAVGETAVAALETGFDIVRTLVTEGPAAAWEKILETLSNLRDMVMEQIMTFVRDRVVQAAITRLVTSLNPAGAFIQAIIAIYNTIMFFVERLRQIGQVAAAVIDSLSAIASGVIAAAANRVEQTMAGLLTLVISFLARIAGLGRVTDAVTSVIDRVRQPIDRALDRVVEWIVARMRSVFGANRSGSPNEVGGEVRFQAAGAPHRLYVEVRNGRRVSVVATTPVTTRTLLDDWRARKGNLANDPPENLRDRAESLLGDANRTETHLANLLNVPAVAADEVPRAQVVLARAVQQLMETFGDSAQSADQGDVAARFVAAHGKPELTGERGFTQADWQAVFNINQPATSMNLRWGRIRGKVTEGTASRPSRYSLTELGEVQLIQLAVTEANENGRATLTQSPFTIRLLIGFLSPTPRLRAFAARLTQPVGLRVALTLKHLGHLTSTDDIQFAWVGGHRYMPHNWDDNDFREWLYERGASPGRRALETAVTDRDRAQLEAAHARLSSSRTTPSSQPHRAGLEAWQTLRELGIAPDSDWTAGVSFGPHEIDHHPDPYLGLADHWYHVGYQSGPSVRQAAFSNEVSFGPVIGNVLDAAGNLVARQRHTVNWVTRIYNQRRKSQGRKFIERWCVHDGFSASATIVFAMTLPSGRGC